MRIAVMGCGAVGGYFGAKLAVAGHDVAFIARGKHLAELQAHGLQLQSPDGSLTVRQAQFTEAPDRVGDADLILFCVKSYDSESAGRAIAPMVSNHTQILSLQNGIDNPDKLACLYGPLHVLAGVVYLGAQLSAPGVVTHSSGGRIIFGPLDGALGRQAKTLVQTLTAAAIPSEASANIRRVQWSKLLWNAPFCAVSCLTRANTREIIESEALARLVLGCMAEVQAAARTQGIDLPRRMFDEVLNFSRGLGEFKPSMLQDLEAGKPLEYQAINGIVVHLLEANGQSAPINQTMIAMLEFLDRHVRQEDRR